MGALYQTWAEIQKQYPREWVYINNPTLQRRSGAVTGGVVVLHTADHADFIRRVFDFPEVVHGAILYTGPDVHEDDEVFDV